MPHDDPTIPEQPAPDPVTEALNTHTDPLPFVPENSDGPVPADAPATATPPAPSGGKFNKAPAAPPVAAPEPVASNGPTEDGEADVATVPHNTPGPDVARPAPMTREEFDAKVAEATENPHPDIKESKKTMPETTGNTVLGTSNLIGGEIEEGKVLTAEDAQAIRGLVSMAAAQAVSIGMLGQLVFIYSNDTAAVRDRILKASEGLREKLATAGSLDTTHMADQRAQLAARVSQASDFGTIVKTVISFGMAFIKA